MELMIRDAHCLLIGVLQTVVRRVLQRLQQTDKKVCYFSRTCDHPEVETVCIGVVPLDMCGKQWRQDDREIFTLLQKRYQNITTKNRVREGMRKGTEGRMGERELE